MVDLKSKLTSRKLWAAIAEFVVALLIFLKTDKTVAEEVGSLIMLGVAPIAYVIGEAWADAGRTVVNIASVPEEELAEAEGTEPNE